MSNLWCGSAMHHDVIHHLILIQDEYTNSHSITADLQKRFPLKGSKQSQLFLWEQDIHWNKLYSTDSNSYASAMIIKKYTKILKWKI